MKSVTLKVPGLWADHHTLAVRSLLAGINGVSDVVASAKNKEVTVSYDPGVVNPAAIEGALAQGGYPVGAAEPPAEAGFVWRKAKEWAAIADRVTTTNMNDLAMSGDHRMY